MKTWNFGINVKFANDYWKYKIPTRKKFQRMYKHANDAIRF